MAETGIRFYRGRKGLSQAAVAETLGLDGGAMSRLETGGLIPTAEQVDKLVELLGVPPTYLFSKHILAEVAERARAAEAAS
jgi:transcriptional regulator with XRE-family HTH domain